jgi:hypothetical protein
LLKWGGLTVAVLGVLLLYVDLHGPRWIVREPPTIENYSEITPAMNFAQIYIPGKATFVKYYDDTRFLGIFVEDEDQNELFVRAYDAETMRLIRMESRRLEEGSPQPKFPAVGDILTVRGNLRVRPGFPMMILQFAEGLSIHRPEATRVTIENLVENASGFEEYRRFEVVGKIIEITDRGWATILTLYELESEAEVSVLLPQVMMMFGGPLEVGIGDTVEVKGAFSQYYGSPQLWVASWDDIGPGEVAG